MPDHKHMTLDQRIIIQEMLYQGSTFRDISKALGKDPSTISKEIRLRRIRKRTGCMNNNYNACTHRFHCGKKHICTECHSVRRFKLCRRCAMCNSFCKDFTKEVCMRLSNPPYVCNGCSRKIQCTLEKQFYDARAADKAYHSLLSECRTGIALTKDELQALDEAVSPLIHQGQSPHHIYIHNKDTLLVSERSIYRYIDAKLLAAINLDLTRKVRFSARKKTAHVKVDKKCRVNRTYQDFLSYMKDHPDIPITEIDTVEGKKGGKVLLTLHFTKAELMLAFIREHNDSASVIDIFEMLYKTLGREDFTRLFRLCLTDNGSEFSNPHAIEYDATGQQRTMIFYCDPNAPFQKGSAEHNHEFIRRFIPKGTDMSPYSQEDIETMMNHINSYARESLSDKCPYDVFSFLYGEGILKKLGCHKIAPQNVTLNKSIFKKEAAHEKV